MVLTIQQKTNTELTTDVLLFGIEAVSEEVNASISKHCRSISNFSSINFLSVKIIKIMLIDSGYWDYCQTNCFAMCAKCLNSMITL